MTRLLKSPRNRSHQFGARPARIAHASTGKSAKKPMIRIGKAWWVGPNPRKNAANAGIVMGAARHDVGAVDLRWIGAILTRDAEVEETGLGAGVLNDPVEAVVWLARRMAMYGQRIEAGQVILSGSFIRPVECPPGCRIAADFGDFGHVSVDFAAH